MNRTKTELKRGRRIFLCGYYGCGNLGDDAILSSLVRALSEREPNLQISYLTGKDGARLARRVGERAREVPRSPLSVMRAIKDCDVLVLGGGSVLQNLTGQASLCAYLSLLSTAQLLRKRTAILAGGLGPIDGILACRATASILRRLDYASFRDAEACAFASSLGVVDPILSADPALLLRAEPCVVPLPERFLLVSLREKTHIPAEAAARRIHSLAEGRALTPVFCNLFPAEDAAYTASAAREISRLYAQKGSTVGAWTLPHLSPEKLLSVTSRAAYVLSGRYHLALFAFASGVPFRTVGSDPKLLAVGREERPLSETVRRAEEDVESFINAVL